MKNNILENINIQQIDMYHHRMELRRSLLTSSYWNKKQNRTFLFWKGGEKNMLKKRFITITISAFIVVFAITLVFMSRNTLPAYADQVAQQSFKAVTNLTPDELKELKGRVKEDSKEILAEAKNEKDLKYFTYDQYIKAHPEFAQMPTPPKIDGIEQPDIKKAQFLEFTDKEGAATTIAIDPDNNLPFFISKKVFKHDGNEQGQAGNVMFRTDRSGEPGISKEGEAGFGISTNSVSEKGSIMFQVKQDGNAVLEVNGKKYKVPEGFKLSTNSPPDIQVKDDGVYINGQKAEPLE